MSGIAKLDALLNRKNQRFMCRDTGWPEPGPKQHVAYIKHVVQPPAPASVLAVLLKRLRAVPQLAAFYERYGSVRLYCDTVGSDSAFYIADPDDWASLKIGFRTWLELLSPDEEEELLPDWVDNYIVIGEVPYSGNYFLVPLSGEVTGHVFEFEHDGFEFIDRGKNFDAFLDYVSTVNASLIEDILCHTRYSDGETETQWLAQEYQFDA